ncbi:MAG TPA: hypothetical protein VF766_07155 [Pyrinomonadaceae bacterium]
MRPTPKVKLRRINDEQKEALKWVAIFIGFIFLLLFIIVLVLVVLWKKRVG